jgi:hypothetical protein
MLDALEASTTRCPAISFERMGAGSREDASAGRVPFRLRIGVTGHRTIADRPAIERQVDEVLSRLSRSFRASSRTPVLFEVVSPLGEGADRIVAERALRIASSILEVPLPLRQPDYERDFSNDESRREFRELLARADRVVAASIDERPVSYERVGEYIVETCDVLVAIWDGGPSRGTGGTTDVLELARRRAMPVFAIDAHEPFAIREERTPVATSLFDPTDRFNARRIGEPSSARLAPGAIGDDVDSASALGAYVSWLTPFFRRAETVAASNRAAVRVESWTLFLGAASAVTAAATSALIDDRSMQRAATSVEISLMLVVFVTWWRLRTRRRSSWIGARFLAERVWSSMFLAFVGVSDHHQPRPEGTHVARAEEWVTRAYREIVRQRPRDDVVTQDVGDAATVLRDHWVLPQIAYYREHGRAHRRSARWLASLNLGLFGGTIAAAVLHLVVRTDGSIDVLLLLLSIALPAFAAAVAGVMGLEQHGRHAEHFDAMAQRLTSLARRLSFASRIETVRAIARRVENELRTEGDVWLDVMRSQDVELPV